MSNELQKSNPVGVVTTTAPATVGFNFFDPVQFETMQRVCKMFASSDLVPDIYRANMKQFPANADENTVNRIQSENQTALTKAMANCMIAVDYAMRVGASPLMVMQNVAIIYGVDEYLMDHVAVQGSTMTVSTNGATVTHEVMNFPEYLRRFDLPNDEAAAYGTTYTLEIGLNTTAGNTVVSGKLTGTLTLNRSTGIWTVKF